MKFNLTVSGMEAFQRDMERYSKTVHERLQREVAETATNIHREATELAPSDTGLSLIHI